MTASPRDLLLIGAGHSHVAVLADWARNGLPFENATVLTPHPTLRYSGMVPGWISGEHSREAGLVDIEGLARAAGVELVLDRCAAIDPAARSVLTREHGLRSFKTASIDVGGAGQAARVLGDDERLIDVRPIDRFVDRLAQTLAQPLVRPLRIAVVGGGAGGVELAFALRNRHGASHAPAVTVLAGEDGVLPGFASAPRNKVRAEMERQNIALINADARIERGQLIASDRPIEADLIVAAIGSGAPDWPRMGGMEVDGAGFILVDQHQRSLSHPHILAAGDCAARADTHVPHSGVHAVHTGPVLAANLRALAKGTAPRRSYTPRRRTLYLLSTGRGEAIASYGGFAAQGRWVARLKAWIDTGWIAKYARIVGQP
ncbi:MAG: FAD-dependent oxidoreductase [Pseudomonadota bacterium]